MSTVAVVLAADEGEGFALPKYASQIRGRTMLDRVVDDVLTWPVDEVIVVLGSDAGGVEDACDLSRVSLVEDPGWAEGSASPLRAVLDLLSRDRSIELCVLARGDQPGVPPSIVAALVDAALSTDAQAVVPKYRYQKGWPIVIASSFWSVFLGLEGAVNPHDVVATHATHVEEVWFDRLAPPTFTTAEDLPEPLR
jgi:CTP:molybdopterin cytidylyltransferase MocA